MRIVVLTVLVCCGGLMLPLSAQNKCEPDVAPTAEQQARRRDGVRIARLVNTAEASQSGAAGKKYVRQEELATSPYVQKRREGQDAFAKSLNFKGGEEILPGWELNLDVTADGYWFMVRDKTDACGFAYISNQSGLIYTAEPIR